MSTELANNECPMKQHQNGTNKEVRFELTEKPDVVEWKKTYFVYVEKKGNFKDTAKAAWGQFFAGVDKIDAQVKREKHISLYRMDEEPWIYRAGYSTSSKPASLPEGYHCEEFEGGFYLRFILTGSYEYLGEACGRVWNIVNTHFKHELRQDWNLENYVNDFKQVKPEELTTEILIPIKSGKVENVKSLAEYHLTEKPQQVEWKSYYYVYVEVNVEKKKGPFQDEAKACWDQMKPNLAEIYKQTKVDKCIAQYRTDTEPWVYRAGVAVSSPPASLPSGCKVEEFPGGSFLSFTLTGGYNHFPEACGRVFNIIGQKYSKDVRKDWNIEFYVNDPSHTKAQDLITQIMVPVNKSNSAETAYQLTEKPDTVEWKQSHFVYCEQKGFFCETAKGSWEQFFGQIAKIDALVKRDKLVSQFRMDTNPHIFRAGATIPSTPSGTLPDGYELIEISGGSYLRFIFIGEFSELPEARQRVIELVEKNHRGQVKSDGWMLQYHVFGTKITEIMVPKI